MIATAPAMLLPTIIELMIMVLAPLSALASTVSAKLNGSELLSLFDDLMVKPAIRLLGPGHKKKIVAYLRFSTIAQSDDSLARQLALIYQAAEFFGLEIVEIFEDRGVSGTRVSRPGLDRALAYVRSGRAKGIMVEDCDRLARRCSIIPVLFDDLKDIDCELWDRRHGHIDMALKANIFAGMAAEDHRKLLERTGYGRRQKIEAGQISVEPYGWRFNEKTGVLEIDPEERDVLLRINADLRAGLNPPAILRSLNAENIPAPRGGAWGETAVRYCARNTLQVGVYIYGRARNGKPQKLPTVRALHPDLAIMSEADYLAGLACLKSKRPVAKRDDAFELESAEASEVRQLRESVDILHGKMFCADCRRLMRSRVSDKSGDRRDFYCKSRHDEIFRHHLSAEIVRDLVLDVIVGELANEAFESRFREHLEAARATQGATAARARISLSNRITAAKAEIVRSFEDDAWGRGFSEDQKAARREELERRVRTADDERIALDADAQAAVGLGKRAQDLKSALEALVRDGLPTDDSRASQRQRALVGAVVHDVVVQPLEDGKRFRLTVLIAPGGDAGSPTAEITMFEREVFSARLLRPEAELYDAIRAASAQGLWTLDAREFSDVMKTQPALQNAFRRWDPEIARRLLNAALISSAVRLSTTHLERLSGVNVDSSRLKFYDLARRGVLAEFFHAAAKIDQERFRQLDPAWPYLTGRLSHVVIPGERRLAVDSQPVSRS